MTGEEKARYHKMVDENIRKDGWHSTFVFADDNTASFCYSTGVFKSFGIPELFISSLPENLSYAIVKSYVNEFKESKSIPLNKKIHNLTDRFPVFLVSIETNKLKDYVLSSLRFYGNNEYQYLQLIYPDTKGKFPNERSYNYDQVILGNYY